MKIGVAGVAIVVLILGGAVPMPRSAAFASASDAPEPKTPCTDMSRACLIEVARTYLDARTDNRVKPFQRVAPHIHRWENGVMTADSASDIVGPAGPGPSQTLVARDLDRTLIDGDQAVFFWRLDKKDSPNGPFTTTVHLIERFKFAKGETTCGKVLSPCIAEIEVVLCTAPHPSEPGMSAPPKDPKWFSHFLCNRDG